MKNDYTVKPHANANSREVALLSALNKIVHLNEKDLVRYVRQCDSIALDAIVAYDCND